MISPLLKEVEEIAKIIAASLLTLKKIKAQKSKNNNI